MKTRRSRKSFTPQDRYFREAKKRGYRSRAAFKLIEIDKKYRIFKTGQRILDLGAAPGGWSQVALAAVGAKGHVIGVDLQNVQRLNEDNFLFIHGNLHDQKTQEQIAGASKSFDVILSDMAPSTSGIKFKDQMESEELVKTALEMAKMFLAANGHFVIKIFPGEQMGPIKKQLKALFGQVHEFSPEASRRSSKEVYLVALGFKGK